MIYVYLCKKCEEEFEIIKSVKHIDDIEACPKCNTDCDKTCRILKPPQIMGADDWNKAEYNPGLGCIVKNKKHRNELAKRMGLVEVGNEKPENIQKEHAKRRKEIQDERWAKA